MDEWLNGNQVRLCLRDHQIEISNDQLMDWRDWGLLHQRQDGLWPAVTVSQIVRILELSQTVRSRARQVIQLKMESSHPLPGQDLKSERGYLSEEFFRIPAEPLRKAMLDVARKIKPYKRKMKQMELWIAAYSARHEPSPMDRFTKLPSGWKTPPREDWCDILTDAPLEQFQQTAEMQYVFVSILPSYLSGSDINLAAIPLDEQIVLLTIRELSVWRQHRRLVHGG
jgi:hypothetical protein